MVVGVSSGLLNSGQESSRAAIALPVDEDVAIRFQDQLVTLDLHMRGNPYEQQSGGKTGGSWRLRDRAPWAVFHIQFDKRAPHQWDRAHRLEVSRKRSRRCTSCALATLARHRAYGRIAPRATDRPSSRQPSDIKVLYRFHQNNGCSKCEVVHTSLPIRPSKVR